MTLSEYERLKQYITEQYAFGTGMRHNEILSSLKELYRDDINSIRRFEQIHSIGQLLRILEIRDTLSEDRVDCLKNVAMKLSYYKDVLKKITDYENLHVPREYGNYYTAPPPVRKEDDSEESYLNSSPLPSNVSIRKRQRIMNTIIEEIGGHWRDLGRNLRIRECTIEDIDMQNKSVPMKVTKMMEIFINTKSDPQTWFFVLCEALEKSKRRTLARSIQEIMTMNI